MPTSLVGVNTLVPNRLVHNSIRSSKVKGLMGYERVVREVAAGKGLRRAAKDGVEIIVYDTKIDLKGIRLNRQIPCALE